MFKKENVFWTLVMCLSLSVVQVVASERLPMPELADTVITRQQELPEVTVSEHRRQQAQRSTAPQHLLMRDDLLRMGATDMADALHRLPGITLRDYGGAGGMKTVSVRGFGAKHTGVSYDGVALGECQTGEIDLSRYTLDNLAALQLSVGDNDHIFISARQASTPAMLSIDTSSPEHLVGESHRHPTVAAQLLAGSFGYVSPLLRVEKRLSRGLSLWAVGEYVYAENDYPFKLRNVSVVTTERRSNSRMNQGHGELNMRWDIDERTWLTGKLYYYDNDRQLPGIVHYYTSISRETLRDRNAFGQITAQRRWQNGLSLKVTAKANWMASLYDDGMTSSQIQDADYWQREYYVSVAGMYATGGPWAFNYSADYALNNLNSTQPTDTRPLRHSLLHTASARYQTPRFTATARLLHSVYLNEERRHLGESSTDGAKDMGRLSPSVGISFELIRGLRLRASYKDIFRVPTFNESYYFHYGSRTLKPEQTSQLNAGLTYTNGYSTANDRGLILSADFYYNKVKDMIVAVPFNMFVWRCVNVGKVRAMGIDATARWQQPLGRGHLLGATANYSLQHVQNRTNPESPFYNNQIAYMPVSTGGVSVSWENPWLNVSVHGEGISSRWTNNEHLEGTLVDGYWEMGATAWRSFRLAKSNSAKRWRNELTLRFDLKNFLDKQYEIVGAYPMPGRSWQLTVGYRL